MKPNLKRKKINVCISVKLQKTKDKEINLNGNQNKRHLKKKSIYILYICIYKVYKTLVKQ